jgi:hypothetical protein
VHRADSDILCPALPVTLCILRPAGHSSSCVSEAVKYSEESRTKCIGLTIETRPDYCLGPHLRDMLTYGCTRIEMGVQVLCALIQNPVGHLCQIICNHLHRARARPNVDVKHDHCTGVPPPKQVLHTVTLRSDPKRT